MENGKAKKIKALVRQVLLLGLLPAVSSCATVSFPTVDQVDLPRFMGTWYVSAGRFTFLEKEVNNAVEIYKYDADKKTIDINFSYRQGSPDGKLKKIPQTGTVVDGTRNSHWLVSPFWPFKFDYLIVALADDYSWVAIGVPNQKYLWIMHRKKQASRQEIDQVISQLKAIHYNTEDIEIVPQKWPNS
jgi:apolipoprotein D and lipocalin family protein